MVTKTIIEIKVVMDDMIEDKATFFADRFSKMIVKYLDVAYPQLWDDVKSRVGYGFSSQEEYENHSSSKNPDYRYSDVEEFLRDLAKDRSSLFTECSGWEHKRCSNCFDSEQCDNKNKLF